MSKFKAIEEAEAAMRKAGDKHKIKDKWAEKYNAYKSATIPSLREREGLWAAFINKQGGWTVSFHKTREAARERVKMATKERSFLDRKPIITYANSSTGEKMLSAMKLMRQAPELERKPQVKAAKPHQHSLF